MSTTAIQGNVTIAQQQALTKTQLERKETTGSGVVGGAEDVPGADQATYSANFGGISITISLPSMNKADFEVLLLEALSKMRDMQAKSQNETITMNAEMKQTAIGEKQQAYDEAQAEMDSAKEKMENASIWDKVKLAFQALGAILSIALGAILIATGVGAVAGGLLIAAGAVGLFMVLDAALQMGTGFGVAGGIAKLANASDETAQKADMGFRIGMAVVQVVLSVAAMFAMPNPKQLVDVATSLQANLMRMINATQAGISIASAGGDVGASVVRYEAAGQQAAGMERQAEGKEMEALIKGLDDMIDQAIQSMIATLDRFNTSLDELSDTLSQRNASIVKIQFKA